MKKPIRIKARSKSGSVHWVIGRVRNGESVPYESVEEAVAHLQRNGWEIITEITLTSPSKEDNIP